MGDWKDQLSKISLDIEEKSGGDRKPNKRNDSYQIGRNRNDRENRNRGNAQKPQNRQNNDGRYVGAPYNFVPFYEKVYEYPEDKLTAHNAMEESLITGELSYEITAETPIMIDDGKGSFFKDAKGRFAIPGSTIRGLIRNNVQVLGLCGYGDDIDDYALMYRNVAFGAEKKYYNNILGAKQLQVNDGNKSYGLGVLLNVHAGYVKNENGKYIIYQTAVDSIKKEFEGMNYYVLSERKIINDYLKHKDRFSYRFFLQNGRSILQHEFKEFFESTDKNGRKHYRGTANEKYRPYYKEISYEVVHEKDIAAVGEPGVYQNKGFAVSTGRMNEKKAVYIIPEIDRQKESIPIPEDDVRAFRIDLKKKENSLKQFGGREYFDLPEEGGMRPIFYIKLDGKLYFGFTPRLRLFYDHTVREGLKQNIRDGGVDYAKAMFGYASPKNSYKSKLSFSDAVLAEDAGEEKRQKLILAEPKPTSYLDYLVQPGGMPEKPTTYNRSKADSSADFTLRGAKQYWLHEGLVPACTVKNEKAASIIAPLAAGAKFVGKIRFQNLTEDELGLLLWSVRLNEDSQMNVGKAKAYGYGRISVELKEAKKLEMQRAYSSGGSLCLDPFCEIKADDAIETYKAAISRHLNGRSIDELPHIRDFFLMKDLESMPDGKDIRYMSLDNREYQSRRQALPSIEEVVGSTEQKR